MRESAQTTSEATSLPRCAVLCGSRKRKLSPTLDRDSIGIGKGSETCWTESTRELSQEWPLDTTAVSAGFDLSSVNGSSRSMDFNSWFSIQVHPQTSTRPQDSQKTFLPSLITSSVGTRGDETTQKKLRAVLLNSETNTLNDNEKWLDEHDYDLRDKAIRDFMKNYRIPIEKGSNTEFSVLKKKWNRGERSFYSHSLLAVKDGCGRATTKYFNARFKALEEAVGRYFLITSNKGKEKRKNATRGDFVFIDPGVRTFLTCYDLNENVVEVGSGAVVRVSKVLHHRRRLQGWRLFGTTKDGKTFKGHISGWVRESSHSRGHAQEGGDVSVRQLRQYIPPEAQLPHVPEAQQEVKGVHGHH
ncbi:hypothetical protein V1522DRAFT_450169 [Lipomyces starkeyi]